MAAPPVPTASNPAGMQPPPPSGAIPQQNMPTASPFYDQPGAQQYAQFGQLLGQPRFAGQFGQSILQPPAQVGAPPPDRGNALATETMSPRTLEAPPVQPLLHTENEATITPLPIARQVTPQQPISQMPLLPLQQAQRVTAQIQKPAPTTLPPIATPPAPAVGATETQIINGVPTLESTPIPDITTRSLASPASRPANTTTTAPLVNYGFNVAPPPPIGSLPPGQEAAMPGSIFSPLAQKGGQILETPPTQTAAQTQSDLAALTPQIDALLSGTVTPGHTTNVGNILGAIDGTIGSIMGGLTFGPLGSLALGAAGSAIGKLIGSIFGGADPMQVPASQIEQAFEATADNVSKLAKAGYLSKDQAQAALAYLKQTGNGYYSQVASTLGSPAGKGEQNMDSVLQGNIDAVGKLDANTAVKPWDAAANSLLMPTSEKGWYGNSLSAASNFTSMLLPILQQAASTTTPATTPAATSTTASQPLPGAGMTLDQLLTLLG
ncbi:MAG: hypothetical protein KGI66_03505 [Patescibacteria group bacterium]|nr:hypothetical protein [Patescibacteria group bacterium]